VRERIIANLHQRNQLGPLTASIYEGKMVDLEIVGEAAYQDHIRQLNRRAGGGDLEILLRPEPRNPHDPNAVAVLADGKPVGYLPRKMAAAWQPSILAANANGFIVAGVASVFGGHDGAPNQGVFGSAPWPEPGTPPAGRCAGRKG
jgi:hypothetical protein